MARVSRRSPASAASYDIGSGSTNAAKVSKGRQTGCPLDLLDRKGIPERSSGET